MYFENPLFSILHITFVKGKGESTTHLSTLIRHSIQKGLDLRPQLETFSIIYFISMIIAEYIPHLSDCDGVILAK